MIFWVVLKLEIDYRVIIYLEGFWFLLEDFFEDYIFAWWNILSFQNSSFALILFYVNGKATTLVLMGFLLMDSCLSCNISVILNLFVCLATPLLHMHHHHHHHPHMDVKIMQGIKRISGSNGLVPLWKNDKNYYLVTGRHRRIMNSITTDFE